MPAAWDDWLQRLRDAFSRAVVSQNFGPSSLGIEPPYTDPVTGIHYAHFHEGVDLVFAGGGSAPIYAPASGRVIFAGQDPRGPTYGYGTHIIIQAANGYRYILGHLGNLYNSDPNRPGGINSGSTVQVGDLVRFGDVLGHQGSTGASTGIHLHLGIQNPQGQWVDPGRNDWRNVFFNLYHSLGAGGAYNPGQLLAPPDPLGRYAPPTGTVPIVGQSQGGPPTEGGGGYPAPTPVSEHTCPAGTVWSEGAGGCVPDITQGLSGIGAIGQANRLGFPMLGLPDIGAILPGLAPAITLLLLGGVMTIAGLHSLSKEKPVQTVAGPAAQAVGTVKKGVELAAAA